MKLHTIAFIFALLGLAAGGVVAGVYVKLDAPFYLAIASVLSALALYLLTGLDMRIAGKLLVIERTTRSLEQADTEQKTIVTALVKSLYALEEGDKTWKGNTEAHYALVRQYLEPVKHLLPPDLQQAAAKDVAQLHSQG